VESESNLISVFGSYMSDLEIEYVNKCLNSQWIGFGETVTKFEEEISRVRNFRNFTMVDSGSNALYLALKLLKLPIGSEVILPAFTWIACANAVILSGLKPVFADVELDTMNISARTVQQVISDKTSCIMVVHFAGLPVDIDPIIKFGFPIIEDAAHAIYSDYKNKPCGSLGDIGIFSFDAVKNLAVGEGGGITCKQDASVKNARELRYCGISKSGFDSAVSQDLELNSNIWWEYNLREPFIKMLPTNISASIGLAQLIRRKELQDKRKEIWDSYQQGLKKLKVVRLPVETLEISSSHSYFTFPIQVPKRNELAKYLLKKDIYTTLRYHPLNQYSNFNDNPNLVLKNTQLLNDKALSLPLHPRLTRKEVNLVIDSILKFYL
jgi:dTDP-4-amino-4,6-dideoxygalactose transaminase